MSFFSDTRETSARYGTYIAEFQELCKRHAVKSGTPEDFFGLAPKLAYDERFRADFCQLTKSVAKREEGQLTLTQILTIVAIAIGGELIDCLGTAGAVPVSLVVVFLSGVGGWSDDTRTTASLVPEAQTTTLAPEGRDEREGLELERRLAAQPNSLDEMTTSLFCGPAVKEALCRLELSTLELKLHLDSIDSRMERIEPHLDDLTLKLGAERPRQPADILRDSLLGREQLPVMRYSQPDTQVAQLATNPEIPRAKPVRQSNASEMRRRRRVVTMLGLLLVVMAAVLGTLLYISHGRLLKGEIGKLLAETIGDAAAKTTSPSSLENTNDASPTKPPANGVHSTPSQATSKSQPSKVGVSPVAIPNGLGNSPRKINLPIRKEEDAPKALEIHLADALPGAIAARSTDEAGVVKLVDAGAPTAGMAAPGTASAAGERTSKNGAGTWPKIFVPASTLVRNAIAQPAPTYPSLARIQRVEGDVLLQASVNEHGRVEAVSVVNGPEPLRNAAVDALRNWRFKPYLMDGHPVAVRTFIDFHFKMAQ